MTTYAYGIANLTNIPSKLILVQDRIDVSLEIDIVLTSVTHVLDASGDNIVFVFVSSLSEEQLSALANLVDIIFEETPVDRVYPEPRTIYTTRVPENLNDDLGGYTIQTSAVNTVNNNKYSCIISTTGNAVWIQDNVYANPFVVYDAIVSTSGEFGSYPLISAAIAAGNEKIFVKPGVYIETAQVVVPSGTIIRGMRASNTIVVFQGLTTPAFFADGNGGVKENAGTVSITQNTNVVTGLGTTFTNLAPGDRLFVEGIFYRIATVSSATSLTITELYRGPSLSGASYVGTRFFSGFRITDITIVNSTSSPSTSTGISFKGIEGLIMNNMVISGFVNNIIIERSLLVKLDTILTRSSTGTGLILTDINQSEVHTIGSVSNVVDGVVINGDTFAMIVSNVFSNSNGGRGFFIDGMSNLINLVGCSARNNGGNGFESSAGIWRINFQRCGSFGNANGANLLGTDVNIASFTIVSNVGDGVILGSECVVTASMISNNGGNGISIANGARYTINSNTIHDNGINGMIVTSTVTGVDIITNNIYNNGARGISLENTDPGDVIISGTIFRNNTDGIYIASSGCIITGCRSSGNINGLVIAATANDTIVSACNLLGNTTNLTDLGVGSIINATKS